jgi:hypothetical protein
MLHILIFLAIVYLCHKLGFGLILKGILVLIGLWIAYGLLVFMVAGGWVLFIPAR